MTGSANQGRKEGRVFRRPEELAQANEGSRRFGRKANIGDFAKNLRYPSRFCLLITGGLYPQGMKVSNKTGATMGKGGRIP
jgi:hypothetical protein